MDNKVSRARGCKHISSTASVLCLLQVLHQFPLASQVATARGQGGVEGRFACFLALARRRGWPRRQISRRPSAWRSTLERWIRGCSRGTRFGNSVLMDTIANWRGMTLTPPRRRRRLTRMAPARASVCWKCSIETGLLSVLIATDYTPSTAICHLRQMAKALSRWLQVTT